jgi:hypothetical protein
MTHSLHRLGDYESLKKDYVLFALTAAGVYGKDLGHAAGSAAKKKRFLDIVASHGPVNMSVSPTHDRRRLALAAGYTLEELRNGICDKSEIYSVFNNMDSVKRVIEELKTKNLGLSVVVSGIFDEVFRCCREISMTPHTVNMSVGIMGRTEMLPRKRVLEMTTMCGHSLVSSGLVEHLINRVRNRKMTSEEAAGVLAKQCLCGIFNTARAVELIELAASEIVDKPSESHD